MVFFRLKKIILFLLIILILLLFFFFYYQFSNQAKHSFDFDQIKNQSLTLINQAQEEKKVFRGLDGILVEKGKENLLAVAAVLENLPGAPKPTLSSASLIYEVPVEGGVTRFLAIFDLDCLPENLGPIRSARPYLAEIAEEYRALFIHAGGSPEVLFKLKRGFYQLFNLDEISWQGRYFYRTNEPSPHNLYLKREAIQKLLTEQKISPAAKFESWSFKEEIKEGQKAEKINIVFSPLYQVGWQYDSENQGYRYYQNNRIYQDKENQELRVKNLIIQYTDIQVIDSEGRRRIKLNGQGRAEIFQNGQVTKSKWFKEAGRTTFYDENGEEIKFLPGKTWIGIVSDKNSVNY